MEKRKKMLVIWLDSGFCLKQNIPNIFLILSITCYLYLQFLLGINIDKSYQN